jgi:hypothetical protein
LKTVCVITKRRGAWDVTSPMHERLVLDETSSKVCVDLGKKLMSEVALGGVGLGGNLSLKSKKEPTRRRCLR